MALAPSAYTREMWDEPFVVDFEVALSAASLDTKMTVTNTGSGASFDFQAALHSYFDVSDIKCLVVCRGPVRKEAFDVFDEIGIREYGMLLSEKDSVVYPRCLAPELRDLRDICDLRVRHWLRQRGV